MKRFTLITILLLSCFIANSQEWTTEQILKANTAKDIACLTIVEKDAIKYINLCRLYPKEFAVNEVENYFGTKKYGNYVKNSKYRQSLIKYLNSMKPVSTLNFDIELYNYAKCLAKEQGPTGVIGHKRIKCKNGNFAECCSYGMDTGLDIAMQWLIDDKVESLGHRINCLNSDYSKIGLSVHTHKKYGICAVADMM